MSKFCNDAKPPNPLVSYADCPAMEVTGAQERLRTAITFEVITRVIAKGTHPKFLPRPVCYGRMGARVTCRRPCSREQAT